MATRGWGGSIALAVGVSAGSAAAQLGLGYGLGIIAWSSQTDTAGEGAWLASLAWTLWIAATSTVLGAVVADRLAGGDIGAAPPSRRSGAAAPGPVATTAWRLILALTAAIGGLLTVPLVAVPARAAHRPDTYAPQLIAGGYAIVGVAVGVAIAIAALSSRAISANIIATTAWLWVLAVASVVNGVAAGSGLSTAQLAIWHFGTGHFLRGTFSLPGAALMMGAALIIGGLAALPAGRRGDNRVGVAVSGAVGPLLVAVSYFLAAPKLNGSTGDEQLSAYLIAPYAVIAGLAGSVLLAALITQREQQLAARRAAAEAVPAPRSAPDLDDGYASSRAYDEPDAPALAGAPATGKATVSTSARRGATGSASVAGDPAAGSASAGSGTASGKSTAPAKPEK
jgi:hypothetical protein